MLDNRTDRDVMILQAAKNQSDTDGNFEMDIHFPSRESALLIELIDAQLIDGTALERRGAAVEGITLGGRFVLEKQIEERDKRRWPARLKKAALLMFGGIGGLLTVYAKTLIEHLARQHIDQTRLAMIVLLIRSFEVLILTGAGDFLGFIAFMLPFFSE